MVPYGTCGVVRSIGWSNAVPPNVRWVSPNWAQAIWMLRSKQHSASEEKVSMLGQWFRAHRGLASQLEQWFWAYSRHWANSSSDFERTVATEQAWAVISSAQRLRRKLEQWFRAYSGYWASLSSDFERTVATEQAWSVISSAQWPRRHARAKLVVSDFQGPAQSGTAT